MLKFKEEMLNKLNELTKTEKEIKFYEVAKELGYKHLSRQDVQDIAKRFLKENTTYRAYHMIDNKNNSLFCGLLLTENEYETEEQFLQPTHGGYRPGSGRKKELPEGATPRGIRLTDEEHAKVKEFIKTLRK